MSDKKHIDRLFQERFKDFEATPSDAVWENIEAQLNKKKKKHRIIPIWWRYAGVAALLLLLLTVGGVYFNNSIETMPTDNVVETENVTPTESTENKILNDSNKTDGSITDNDSQNDLEKKSDTEKTSDEIIPLKETSIAEIESSKNKNESKGDTNPLLNKKLNTHNQLIKTESSNAVASDSKEKNNPESLLNKPDRNTVIASNNEKDNEAIKNEESLIDTKKAEKLINDASKNNTAIAKIEKEETTEALLETKEKSLSIEDAINKDKDIIEEEEKSNRWSIAPNAAPVYFNSLGEGSSIDPQFNSNSKSTELNMSYGIKASYALNKKLSIRSGINKVNLGYNTNNVVAFQSVGLNSNALALQNIDSNSSNNALDNFSLISGENINSSKRPESFTTKSNTSLNQSLGYIEIPLEIQYTLSNKKLGINVIGGFSSFFLSNNKIFSEAEGTKTLLGEANNVNDVSYSANFGLGLNYKFSKKIDLNLEPMFKYQINTFNNTSGDFKPYFIGIYTGFAIKF